MNHGDRTTPPPYAPGDESSHYGIVEQDDTSEIARQITAKKELAPLVVFALNLRIYLWN